MSNNETQTERVFTEAEMSVIKAAYERLKPLMDTDFGEPLKQAQSDIKQTASATDTAIGVIDERIKYHNSVIGRLQADVINAQKGSDEQFGAFKAETEAINARIDEIEKQGGGTRVIEITDPKGKKTKVEGAHACFSQVLFWVTQGVNVMLIGPAGTGKTYLAEQVAKALDRRFSIISINEQLFPATLFGQRFMNGDWKRTSFWEAYTGMADCELLGGHNTKHEKSTVVCLDELDRILPNTGCALNAALSGNVASFYDTPWDKDPGVSFIATANTHGDGLSNKYTGANNLDKSLLNRFVMVYVDYDPQLEAEIYGDTWWLRYCQAIRKVCVTNNVQVDISMRQVAQGLAGLDEKFPGNVEDVQQQVVWERFQPASVAKRVEALMTQEHGANWNNPDYWKEKIQAEADAKEYKKKNRGKKAGTPSVADDPATEVTGYEDQADERDILDQLLATAGGK